MRYKPILLFIFLLASALSIRAQENIPKDTFNIASRTIRFPGHFRLWGFKVSAGLSMVQPPKDLLENSIQAPLVNIHATFGMPWKLSLEGDITTIVVSNQFALGPKLTFPVKNFGIAVGWDVAFVYGQLKQFGFDNSTRAWIQYPNLTLGYKLKKMSFSLKGELVTITNVSTKSGDNEVTHSKDFFNGFTVAFYLEQRIHKNKVFVIGLKDSYEKYYWPTWMLFSTFNRYYNIPELYFSWIIL